MSMNLKNAHAHIHIMHLYILHDYVQRCKHTVWCSVVLYKLPVLLSLNTYKRQAQRYNDNNGATEPEGQRDGERKQLIFHPQTAGCSARSTLILFWEQPWTDSQDMGQSMQVFLGATMH